MIIEVKLALKNISIGLEVEIVQKQHQRTGELTNGFVKRILTKSAHHPHGMLLTRTPTFELKSHLFAGCVFIVGLDTIARINEPRYYNNDIAEMARSIRTIAENGCRFLVFARKQYNISTIGSNFKVGGSLDSQLDELCEFVPADEFCMELSSTDIRDRQRN